MWHLRAGAGGKWLRYQDESNNDNDTSNSKEEGLMKEVD